MVASAFVAVEDIPLTSSIDGTVITMNGTSILSPSPPLEDTFWQSESNLSEDELTDEADSIACMTRVSTQEFRFCQDGQRLKNNTMEVSAGEELSSHSPSLSRMPNYHFQYQPTQDPSHLLSTQNIGKRQKQPTYLSFVPRNRDSEGLLGIASYDSSFQRSVVILQDCSESQNYACDDEREEEQEDDGEDTDDDLSLGSLDTRSSASSNSVPDSANNSPSRNFKPIVPAPIGVCSNLSTPKHSSQNTSRKQQRQPKQHHQQQLVAPTSPGGNSSLSRQSKRTNATNTSSTRSNSFSSSSRSLNSSHSPNSRQTAQSKLSHGRYRVRLEKIRSCATDEESDDEPDIPANHTGSTHSRSNQQQDHKAVPLTKQTSLPHAPSKPTLISTPNQLHLQPQPPKQETQITKRMPRHLESSAASCADETYQSAVVSSWQTSCEKMLGAFVFDLWESFDNRNVKSARDTSSGKRSVATATDDEYTLATIDDEASYEDEGNVDVLVAIQVSSLCVISLEVLFYVVWLSDVHLFVFLEGNYFGWWIPRSIGRTQEQYASCLGQQLCWDDPSTQGTGRP